MITVIYITANKENEEFEQKIKEKLLEVIGDNPLISVSQKPIDFGKNICIGEIGQSYRNAYRQMLVGAKAAQTEYVAIAESDQLYPPGFFDFKPSGAIHYMYDNLWVLDRRYKYQFKKKIFGDWVGIVKRKYLIKRLKITIEQTKDWTGGRIKGVYRTKKRGWEWFSGLPVITIKTFGNINKTTKTLDDRETELPHWGKAKELSEYLCL